MEAPIYQRDGIVQDSSTPNTNEIKLTVNDGGLEHETEKSLVTDDAAGDEVIKFLQSVDTDVNVHDVDNLDLTKESSHHDDSEENLVNDEENLNEIKCISRTPRSASITTIISVESIAKKESNNFEAVTKIPTLETSKETEIPVISKEENASSLPIVTFENLSLEPQSENLDNVAIGQTKSITILRRPESTGRNNSSNKNEPLKYPPNINIDNNNCVYQEGERDKEFKFVSNDIKREEKLSEDENETHKDEKAFENETIEGIMQNVKILKRPEGSNHCLVNTKSTQLVKTLEQRQRDYDDARMRIFGEIQPPPNTPEEEILEVEDVSEISIKTEIPHEDKVAEKVTCWNLKVIENEEIQAQSYDHFPEVIPETKIYADGSQHPLHCYYQPVTNVKPYSDITYYSQYDYSSNFCPFSNGGSYNFMYPFDCQSNFIGHNNFNPNFSICNATMFYPNFCSYESTPNFVGVSEYLNFDNLSTEFEFFYGDYHPAKMYYDGYYQRSDYFGAPCTQARS